MSTMTLPKMNPPPMKTPHGVPMSARMARVYGWLNDNGVSLTPFSTDDCVERSIAKIEALRDALQAKVDEMAPKVDLGNKAFDLEYQAYANVLGDLAPIMRRRPATRVR